MKPITVALAGAVLAATCGGCMAEAVRTEFEQSFIGRGWSQSTVEEGSHPLSERCSYVGRSLLTAPGKYSVESFDCEGRQLEMLVRTDAPRNAEVLDAVLLPQLGEGEKIMMTGDCELNRKIGKFFFVQVKLGKRESVNWKTGVKAAWYPNPETGKIEVLPTRGIVCNRPTPP